tara:strand:+ start:232 stop:618 length:387 start_codon:yes stop_codon:yes gene_type:complete
MATPVIKHTSQELSSYPSNFSQSTSTFDNCVLLNAILKNSNPYDDDEVRYLRQLQGADLQSVTEYYSRSESIIAAMREQGADNNVVWNEIDKLYIDAIIEKLKVRNFQNLFSDIRNVLEQLELKYGVK